MKGVYKIRNIVNNKFYLGSSKEIEKREQRHFRDLRNGVHHNLHLQRAFDKYGEKKFKFENLLECDDYIEVEQNMLNEINYNNCYNLSKNATGGDLISYHPNKRDIVQRISSTLKKKHSNGEINLPDITGDKNPNWKGGKTFCKCGNRISSYAKTCAKCRDRGGKNNPFFGKKHSKEFKQKLSKMRKGSYNGNQEKSIKIEEVVYKSLSQASKILNIPTPTIHYRLNSKNVKYKNYIYNK